MDAGILQDRRRFPRGSGVFYAAKKHLLPSGRRGNGGTCLAERFPRHVQAAFAVEHIADVHEDGEICRVNFSPGGTDAQRTHCARGDGDGLEGDAGQLRERVGNGQATAQEDPQADVYKRQSMNTAAIGPASVMREQKDGLTAPS